MLILAISVAGDFILINKNAKKKCLKCFDCLKDADDENLVEILDISSVKFKDGLILCKKHQLERRYTNLYFKPTLISQVAIPKFKEIKYKVMKNIFQILFLKYVFIFLLVSKKQKSLLKMEDLKK